MKATNLGATALLALTLPFAAVACGDDGASNAGSGGESSSGPGAGKGGDASSGTLSSGSSSNPCDRGLVECDGTCVDVFTDPTNCGACGVACEAGGRCHERACRSDLECSDQTDCDGLPLCARATYESIDDCGACGNACAGDEYCYSHECRSRGGDGTSCASPFLLNDDESMQFWFEQAGAAHLFPCGPLDERPAVWFRWTAQNDGVEIKIAGNEATDDLVVEIFSAATCDAAVSLGCNDNGDGLLPELEIPTQSGATYFLAVSYGGESPPPGRFSLHMDD